MTKIGNDMQIKNAILLRLAMLIISFVLLGACSDDDDTNEPEEIEVTEKDVAEIIGTSLSDENGGLVADINYMLEEVSDECGYYDAASLHDSENGDDGSYEINYEYSVEVICDENDAFVRMDYNYEAYREADLIRLDVTDTIQSVWKFYKDQSDYLLEGDYNYVGSEEFKVRDENSYDSDISYTSSDLRVSESGDFLSGELAYNQELIVNSDTYYYKGTAEITSTNIMLLDISEFTYLYEIDLITGDVEQIDR